MVGLCRRPLLGGSIALLIASCTSRPLGLPDSEIAEKLGPDAPLLPFYRALTINPTVTILQIGDSHADGISDRMRELFQARFGDAGRGVLPPGVPYRGYRAARVSVTQEGWSTVSSSSPGAAGLFGITGLRQHANGYATMTLTVNDSIDLASADIEVLRQPHGGTLLVQLEHGSRVAMATAAPTQNAAWQPVPPAAGSHTLTVEALGDGPVDVLAWNLGRGRPGVIYANLGAPGAEVDPTLARQEMRYLEPSLIILPLGTTAGFRDSTDVTAYAADFAASLRELHAAAPGAALLILGPPDVYRRRRKDSAEPVACGDPNWTEPANLRAIREVQRRVAPRENAYFWDWQAAMGGPCGVFRWAGTRPPMAAPDRGLILTPGYRATAEALFRTLMDGYQRYRALLHST
jgi:hypothetical protein